MVSGEDVPMKSQPLERSPWFFLLRMPWIIGSFQDPIDHPHIKGATVKGVEPLFEAWRLTSRANLRAAEG